VVLATQSLSDAARSGILDVLIESCPTKIFLPNEAAGTAGTPEHPGPRDLYEAMGLNETQIDIIRTAAKKRHYYLVSPKGDGCSTSAWVRSRCHSPASAPRNRSRISANPQRSLSSFRGYPGETTGGNGSALSLIRSNRGPLFYRRRGVAPTKRSSYMP